MDSTGCTPSPQDEAPQAMAFTVTFGTAKTATNNKFVKRHSRNLSLPVVNVYDRKTLNGNNIRTKKIGNHSDDCFSSETEDHGQTKILSSKVTSKDESGESSEQEDCSDVVSETGTYTIDKETEPSEVVTARLSIDTNFGIETSTMKDSKTWVNDWAAKSANLSKISPSASATSLLPVKTKNLSRIPSPLSPPRAKLGSRGQKVPPATPLEKSRPNSPNGRLAAAQREEVNETERYLKSTERAMSALAAHMSLSIDSGGESESESRRGRGLHRYDSSVSDSGARTRYNRAFSLRRGRLEDDNTSNITSRRLESPPIRPVTRPEASPRTAPQLVRRKSVTSQQPLQPPPSPAILARGDPTRTSLRSKTTTPKSPLLYTAKRPEAIKKKPTNSGGGRSNSTLSSKEVEFQNWKRRKSYDPMKAAMEGKKKEAARKSQNPPIMSQSSTTAITTPKSPVNSVLRSASFHTTRQLGGGQPSSSEEEEEEEAPEEEEEEEEAATLSLEDWPRVPKGSMENTSGGSRGSLHSNNSGSPRQRPRLEGVDNIVVSAISGLSYRLNSNAAVLVKKLRYLYDEESDKYKQLSGELEQLEVSSEQCSQSPSLNKTTSRELAITLKNLKRLDSTIRVLNDVLFENVEYE